MNHTPKKKNALIVCDMQPDMLRSISPESKRQALIELVRMSIDAAARNDWTLVYSGLQFPNDYSGLSSFHPIYGALKRLYDKTQSISWFTEKSPTSQVEPSLIIPSDNNKADYKIWRQGHLPPTKELLEVLEKEEITHVTIVGIKAAYSIQVLCQVFCDVKRVQHVQVVRECIQDDDQDRLQAMLHHLIPIYATVISLSEFVDGVVGLENYQCQEDPPSRPVKLCCNVGRGGHAPLYMKRLLLRDEKWQEYPRQEWYNSGSTLMASEKQYYCPLGKRQVDLCDEPQFSSVSTFIKGRENLDEKEKVHDLAHDVMPPTWFIRSNGTWSNNNNQQTCTGHGPWFLKECDKNGGRAVQVYNSLEACRQSVASLSIHNNMKNTITHVVQQHVQNPRLYQNGRKCHLKLYNLLYQKDSGKWNLCTHRDAYLSTSPNAWDATDLSPETQMTIQRDERIRFQNDDTDGWSFSKCQEVVSTVVSRAIQQNKLTCRPIPENNISCKPQFEIFSADLMLDSTSDRVWLVEFNFSPVLFDPLIHQELTTPGLQWYAKLHQQGKGIVNDGPMMHEALDIVLNNKPPTYWKEVALEEEPLQNGKTK